MNFTSTVHVLEYELFIHWNMHAACIWFGRLYAYLLLSIMYSSPSSFSLPSLSWTLLDIPQKTQFSLKQTLHVLLPSVIQLETFSKLLIRINMYTEPLFTSELLKEIVPLSYFDMAVSIPSIDLFLCSCNLFLCSHHHRHYHHCHRLHDHWKAYWFEITNYVP